ncbi:MAG: amino acid racemase [Actinomycetota bacterium]|nr:amino acid racemase [Actinomycetota bacterium]
MEHAGILAHSAEGAALCLRAFAAEGIRQLGPHAHPEVTLDCIALAESMPAWEAADYPAIRAILARSAARLAAAGASFFVCPDNSAHLALEQAGDALPLPGLHIADEVADQAVREGRRRVGILGTRFTMGGWIYPRALGSRGIEHAVPAEEDRALVDRVIFDELVNGVFSDASQREYVRVIEGFQRDGCDAVALVCTEIPLLVGPETSPLPVLDSTRLLARAAVEVGVGRRPVPVWRGGPPDR